MKHSIRHITAALIIACAVSGCGASNEYIGELVKESMQETFASDPYLGGHGLRVTEVTVIHLEGTQYQGMATVMYGGHPRQIGITVLWDGEYVMWEAPMGSFLFLEGW